MGEFISYGKQWIDEEDIREVEKVLRGAYITQGSIVKDFEDRICELTGAKYCAAVSNGTAALHIAVSALRIDEGMEGITSPITFVASANCMVYNRLKPVFVDIDPKTYNLDLDEASANLRSKTKLIIPVHFAGQPVDMVKLSKCVNRKDVFIVEDAAHAIGSKYSDGGFVGNCEHSDMTTFSFHPVKTITTGEGGAVTTNDIAIYKRLLRLRSHGITKSQQELIRNPGPWYYEMQDLGFNYRITDIQCALGISQLYRLRSFVERRREIVSQYNEVFDSVDWLTTPYEEQGVYSAFHLYVLKFDYTNLGKTRVQVIDELKKMNIGTQVHYIPVYTQPYYQRNFNFIPGLCPNAERYYEQALSIPLYPKMTDENVQHVIRSIKKLKKM